MSRSLDRDEPREEEKLESSGGPEGLARSGGEKRPRVTTDEDAPKSFGENRRERIVVRDHEYRIRSSEDKTLRELGQFRIIREDDLVRGVYGDQDGLARSDLRSLRQQGLIRSINFRQPSPTRVHTLTGNGYNLVTARSGDPRFYYFGIVKPAEVEHDSLLYRAYLRERDHIQENGGTIKGIVLDSHLKGEHFRRLNKSGQRDSYRKVQAESAQELHLPVVDGHVMFPDFRIEYEDECGELARSDVEVATGNYREQHLGAKVSAGFRVYSSAGSSGGVRVQSGQRLKGHAFPQETRITLPL